MAESHRSGQSLDRRFTLIRRLGEGGMGEVWLARDEQSGREVAAKILPPDTPAANIARLESEFDSLSRLAHPNIVPVLSFHRTAAGPALIMEPVLGSDIGSLVGGSPADILDAVIPLADALAYAHDMGVVHRDIKPSNVLIDAGGTPRLVDFGISGSLPDAGESGREISVSAATAGGSRWYASPEQVAGVPPHRADDAWALGVLLHVLIAGVPPGEKGALRSPWPLPEELRDLIAALTATPAADRLADMNEVRRRLEEIHSRTMASPTVAPRSAPLVAPPRRLVPPPRAEPVRPGGPSGTPAAGDTDAQGRWARWGTRAAFALLALGAAFVFFLLPDWVENREPPPAPPLAPPPTAAPVTAEALPPVERLPVARPTAEAPLERPEETPPPARAPEPRQLDLPTRSAAKPAGGAPSTGRFSPFDAAMSEGLAAIERGDPATARDAFTKAAGLDPESSAARDGLAQAEKAYRLEVTRGLRLSAAEHEAAGRWSEALADYEAILKLDPALEFALDGKARSRERADLATGFAYHLAALDRLSSPEARRTAESLVERAARLEPRVAALDVEAERLARQLDVYSTPVPVTLVSDNLTNVTIYRVGRQGTFTRKELELLPGTYTVVGSRAGFRDVRARLEVPPGSGPGLLTVRCKERI